MENGDFDEHRGIVYTDLSKLYWNIYPFKVKVTHDIPLPRERYWGMNTKVWEEWKNAKIAHLKFFYQRKRHCPQDTTLYKAMDNGIHAQSCSFFFKNAEDAKYFIKKNKRHVSEVERPVRAEEVNVLASAGKRTKQQTIIREFLFWNKYRFCVEFKEQSVGSEQWLDDRVMELFNNKRQKKRYSYTYSKRRRLYLSEADDLLLVYMALHEKFRMETHVILKKDIK